LYRSEIALKAKTKKVSHVSILKLVPRNFKSKFSGEHIKQRNTHTWETPPCTYKKNRNRKNSPNKCEEKRPIY
jgi:hypothetical protein